MESNSECKKYAARLALNAILMEYDPVQYDTEELKIVYRHCGNLYHAFCERERHPSYLRHAIEDCTHYWNNRESFRGVMDEEEYKRLLNELSYIRLILGL